MASRRNKQSPIYQIIEENFDSLKILQNLYKNNKHDCKECSLKNVLAVASIWVLINKLMCTYITTHRRSIILYLIITMDMAKVNYIANITHVYIFCSAYNKGYIKIIAEETFESLKSSSFAYLLHSTFPRIFFSLSMRRLLYFDSSSDSLKTNSKITTTLLAL